MTILPSFLLRVSENLGVAGVHWERITQELYLMTEFLEGINYVVGCVMIEQEVHTSGDAICLATNKSISPR